MSYIVPGPGRRPDAFFATKDTSQRPAAPGSRGQLPRLDEQLAATSWPPVLRNVVADDDRRTQALADGRLNTANAALHDVVRGLDDLLTLAASRIKAEPVKRARPARRDNAAVSAGAQLADLPLREVGALLHIPADDVDTVLAAVRQPSFDGRKARREALRSIKQLRRQLQEVDVTKNHSRLNRLRDFIVRLVLVLGTTVGSQSVSELVAGDPHVEAFLQVAVGALVSYALKGLVDVSLRARHDRNPTVRSAESHEALLSALADAAALTKPEAYANEHTVLAFRLLVRSAHSWVTCFEVHRPFTEKLQYWQALDRIAPTIRSGTLQDFETLHRQLKALTPA
ncbi:MAG TPA: hypothetical protein VGL05_06315 [Kribbella sp.]